MSLKNKKYLIIVGLIAITSVIASISLSYLSYAQQTDRTVTIEEVTAPKPLLSGKNVLLAFPLKLTNSSTAARGIGLSLDCGKGAQTQTYTQSPGSTKQIFNYQLSNAEIITMNNFKKTKGSVACTLSSEEGQTVSFDLYRNRIRLDIKNLR